MKNALVAAVVSAVVSVAMFYVMPAVSGGGGPAATGQVDVPNLAGLTPAQARQLLDPRGLALELTAHVDDMRYPAGTICEQQPLDSSRLARGAAVKAKVVRVVERVKVPALTDRPEAEAKAMLEAVKLKVGQRTEKPDEKAAAGTVLAAAPAPDTEVMPGATVDLTVSGGPPAGPATEVPRVTGRKLGGAKQVLEKAGFVLGDVRYGRDEDSEDGVVLRQTPAAGSKTPKGSKVELLVNNTD
jgi:serine/threonine-protein kinase